MGTFSGSALINEVARRLRDNTNTAYPRVTVLDILNRCQDAVNVRLGLVHATATFTTIDSALYSTATIASNFARAMQMFDQNDHEIDMIEPDKLPMNDKEWLRTQGTRPNVFAVFGREILAISPIPIVPVTLKLVYVKHPTALADAGAPLWDLPDEHKPLVLDLTEAVLCFRGRQYDAMQEALGRVAGRLGMEDAMQIFRRQTPGEKSTTNPMIATPTT